MTRVVLAVLVLAAVLHGQAALAGKWQGQTKNGSQIVLDLTTNKTALAGTLTRNGQPSTIAEGKVLKNTLTFKATLGDQTETLSGELRGELLRVWLDRQGPEHAVVFERKIN